MLLEMKENCGIFFKNSTEEIVWSEIYAKITADESRTIAISVTNVRIWLKNALRLVCVWKIFCKESKIEAKKRLAIHRTKRPAMISNVLTAFID